MATKPTRATKLIGGARRTGVFISKEDFRQLLEVIALSKAKDNLIDKIDQVKIVASGRSVEGVVLDAPTIGSMSIRDFVEKLAKAYNMPEGRYYGVNKNREIMEWASPDEIITGQH